MATPNVVTPIKLREKAQLMSASEMERTLLRMAQRWNLPRRSER